MNFNPLGKNFKRAIVPDHTVTKFFGNNTEISDILTMPDGFSPDSLNWITGSESDCLILRRGTALLGKTRQTGAGKITGLGIAYRPDGYEVPIYTHGRKIKYYDLATDDTYEAGIDVLPATADGEECSIANYQNLAGAFVYITSENSSVYKIPAANPGSVVDQAQVDYKGFMKFGQSRSILFNRKGKNGFKDLSGLYMSWVDAPELKNALPFAQVTGEAVGNAGFSTYSYTLATVAAPKTAVQVQIYTPNYSATTFTGSGLNDFSNGGANFDLASHVYTVEIDGNGTPDTFKWRVDGGSYTTGVGITGALQVLSNGVSVKFNATTGHTISNSWSFTTKTPLEIFLDNKSGGLLSNLGQTGTINYATGAVVANFLNVTTRNVYANYFTEDATQHGVVDFSFAGTRVAGTGRYYSQFDGAGSLNAVYPLANVFYGFHATKTWQTTVPSDDDDTGTTPGSNLPFREKMGVANPYSAFGGATGIYYINNANPNRPEVYQLQLFTGATAANVAHPVLISKQLNLSAYVFEKAVMFEWGIYILLAFQQVKNGVTDAFNTRVLLYNKKTGSWDFLDYPVSRLAEFNGTLISGDPLSNNIFTLFSGFDDDGYNIANYWTSGSTNHGISGQKVCRKFIINGLIQTSQSFDISFSYDGGPFIKTFTVNGTDSFVDTGSSIAVGSVVEGSKIIGGGSPVTANPFLAEFTLQSPKYVYIRVKFEATGGGYLQLNYYKFKNIIYKGSRSLPERTV